MNSFNGYHIQDTVLSRTATHINKRRTIGNFINYQNPAGVFLPAVRGIANAPGTPPNWSGQFDFRDQNLTSALQFFSHDVTDSNVRAMWGIRVDGSPDIWANIKAYNPDNLGVETTTVDENTQKWSDIWTNADLEVEHAGHVVKKRIILSGPGHAYSWRFSLRLSPGATYSMSNGGMNIMDVLGNIKIVLTPPWGHDAGGIPGGNQIRCSMSVVDTWGPGNKWPIIEISANADDFSAPGFTYPVTIDPTATLQGSSALEENTIFSGQATYNYGALTTMPTGRLTGAGDYYRTILRVNTSLPSGVITGIRYYAYQYNTLYNDPDAYIAAYEVAPANAVWNVGTAVGSLQANTCCYNRRNILTPATGDAWAGGINSGCGTVDTDILSEAGGQPESPAYPTANAYVSWTIPTDWDIVGAGILLRSRVEDGGSSFAYYYATDNGSNKPYFEVDYTEVVIMTIVDLNDGGSSADMISMSVDSTDNYLDVTSAATGGNAGAASGPATDMDDGEAHLARMTWQTNDLVGYSDAVIGTADSSVDIPDDLDRINIGCDNAGANQLNGLVTNIKIYSKPTLK